MEVVSGPHSGQRVVAKFYDPLYYDDGQDDVDPLLSVDVEYSRESTAYRYLLTRGQQHIPNFYGTYSLELPVSPGVPR